MELFISPAQNQQNSTFIPTELMEKWVDKALELGTKSPTEIADSLKMDRSTFYKWQIIPGFIEWWNDRWETYREILKFKLINIALEQSRKGKIKFFIALIEMLGMVGPRKS